MCERQREGSWEWCEERGVFGSWNVRDAGGRERGGERLYGGVEPLKLIKGKFEK